MGFTNKDKKGSVTKTRIEFGFTNKDKKGSLTEIRILTPISIVLALPTFHMVWSRFVSGYF